MADELQDLIDNLSNTDALEQQVNAGKSAKAQLAEVAAELQTLTKVQSICSNALDRADKMKADATSANKQPKGSDTYNVVSAAVGAVLGTAATVGTKANQMAVIVDTPLPSDPLYPTDPPYPYKSYISALATADTKLADAIAAATMASIALVAARATLDARIATLVGCATAFETRLAQANAFLASATVAAQSKNHVAAWWALHHVDALCDEIAAAASVSDSLLADFNAARGDVESARKDYAVAYMNWLTKRQNLSDANRTRTNAAAALERADAKVLAALANVTK